MKMKQRHEAFAEKTAPHMYKIGMFAQMNHITVKALRFYEEQGLLSPAFVDSENGYRYYTMNQMADIHRITALKQAGFTLDDIKLANRGTDASSLLSSKKAALLRKIAE
ncbi:MAG: MerR family transcriptional regulator, partial [Anaerovoracaceae bacterium]